MLQLVDLALLLVQPLALFLDQLRLLLDQGSEFGITILGVAGADLSKDGHRDK
ncbi:MAG: hypothetical protein QM811_32015 [Pirellulales bacterium]